MVIKDFQKEKLEPGEMYNHQEAVALFEELKEEVRTLVDKVNTASRPDRGWH